jgi:hypothetical protein
MNPAMKQLGYQQITSLSSATALTVPAGTALAIVIPQTQAVRWRDDGTSPTATIGYPLAVGSELYYDSASISQLKFIEQTASAAINVCYYGFPAG